MNSGKVWLYFIVDDASADLYLGQKKVQLPVHEWFYPDYS